MPCADEVNALVLDIGTCLVKAGYAGDDVPKAVFPSVSMFAEARHAPVCSCTCNLVP